MNLFTGSGRLVKNATVNGPEKNVLKFTVAAKHGYNKDEEKDRVEFIPCVIFKASEKLKIYLAEQGKGILIEFQGRLSNSWFKDGEEKKYRTEVVIRNSSFNILAK